MRRAIGSLAVWIAVVLRTVGPAGAEEKSVSERVDVRVVDVRVSATDKNGNPITDLREDEFIVKDNGVRQQLGGVHLVQSGSAIPEAATTSATGFRLPSHYLFLFDLTYNDMAALKNARQAALAFFLDDLPAGDDAAVFTIDVGEGVKMLMNFTQDREQLADALFSMGGTKSNAFLADSAGMVRIVPQEAVGPVKRTWARKGLNQGPRDTAAEEFPYFHKDFKHAQVQDYRTSAARYMASLSAFARSLDTMPGRKIITLFSMGFDIKALGGETLQEALESAENFIWGEFSKMDLSSRGVDQRNIDLLQQIAAGFSSSDCRVFCIDPSGNRPIADSDDTPADAATRTHTMLERFAAETGGQVYRHTNRYDEVMQKVTAANSSYYLLVYNAPRGSAGKYHQIDVDVTRPGVRVSHRKGYFDDKPFEQYNRLERELQIAAIVNEARSPAGILVAASALPLPGCIKQPVEPGAQGLRYVEGIVEVPAEVLEEMGAEKELEFFAFALSTKTRDVLAYSHTIAKIPDELKNGAQNGKGGMRYLGVMAVPEGEYRIIGIARALDSGVCAVGNASVSVTPTPGLHVASCLLSEGGTWTTVAGRQSQCTPLSFSGKPVAVRAEPRVASGEECLMLVRLVGLSRDAATGKPSMDLSVRAIAPDGTATALSACHLLQGNWATQTDYEAIFRLKLPDTLGRGQYRLDVEATDGVTQTSGSAAIPFRVGDA